MLTFLIFQIEHQAFGSKTNDTVINCENDDNLILKESLTLSECGVKNETEISFFKLDDYIEYKTTSI